MLLDVMETLYNELYEHQEEAMNFAEQLKKKGIQLKFPEWQAEKETALKQQEAKILSLFKQGKSVEEVEQMLAQKAATSGGPHPAMT